MKIPQVARLAIHVAVVIALAGLGRPAVAVDASPADSVAWFNCVGPETTVSRCARLDVDGEMRLERSYSASLRYDRRGLADVRLQDPSGRGAGGWFYVRRDGLMAEVMIYDNGPDAFVDGRARSPLGAKIGYVDRTLHRVIPAKYDGAYPFEKGAAVVCIGCAPASDGEHGWHEGGAWGCIDRYGRELAPFRPWQKQQAFAELCRPHRRAVHRDGAWRLRSRG